MINLRQLDLDGWLSYDKAVVKLDSPGITCIRGKVGSGKSAILEAIFYLLFGKTLRNKDSVNSLANKVLDSGYTIKLTFDVDSAQCFVQETRGRQNNGLKFTVNGVPKAGKTDPDTRRLIIDTLGMSAEDFRSIAFLGQRQAQLLVEGSEGERAQAIVDIFGLQRYDDLIAACNEDIKDTTRSIKDMTAALAVSESDFESLEKSLLGSVAVDTAYDESDLDRLNGNIATFESKLSKVRNLAEAASRTLGQINAYDRQRDQIDKIKQQIISLRKDLATCKKPEENQGDLEKLLSELTEKRAAAEAKLAAIREKLSQVKSLENTCPVNEKACPVHVPDKYKDLILAKCVKLRKKFKSRITAVSDKLVGVEADVAATRTYSGLKYALESKEDLMHTFKLDERLPPAEEQEAKIQKCKKAAQELNDKLSDARRRYADVRSALAVVQEREANKKRIGKALEEKEQAITDLKTKIDKYSLNNRYLSGALAVFKKMKMYKIDLVLDLLNKHLKDVLKKVSDGEFHAEFISQKQSADKKKVLDKIGIIVYDAYKALPIELCSGGQATEVGLSVLFSVWKTANEISQKGVSSLWLDEVFGPLDEEVVNRVFDSVIAVVQSLGTTSVKVISHRDLDSRLFDHFWHVKRKNGISTIKTS